MPHCPTCQQPLHPETHSGVAVDVCDQHGIWLDRTELFQITERHRHDTVGPFADLLRRVMRPGADTSAPGPCPHCREALTPVRYHEVQIDWCAQHGVWLDSGELEAILNNLRLDPAYLGGVALRVDDLKY